MRTLIQTIKAQIAQAVERQFEELRVGGATPSLGAKHAHVVQRMGSGLRSRHMQVRVLPCAPSALNGCGPAVQDIGLQNRKRRFKSGHPCAIMIRMQKKRCPNCDQTKPATREHFYADKAKPSGLRCYCKKCVIVLAGVWTAANKEASLAAKRRSNSKHREAINAKRQEKYGRDNRAKINAYKRDYYRRSKEANTEAHQRRFASDKAYRQQPHIRLTRTMMQGVRSSLRGKKNDRWQRLVGYTVSDLREHIEKQFTGKMSWDNFGKWHIDHIVPISSFAFTDSAHPDFLACWALSNLRPLWRRANQRKNGKRNHLL